MEQEDVVFRGGIGLERRRLPHVGYRQNRKIALVKGDALWLAFHHRDPEWGEQRQNASRFRHARSVVIAGDHHHGCVGQHLHEARELVKGVENRRIAGANGVKYVAGDEHQVGLQLDHLVDDAAQRQRDIRLTLVDAGGGLPLILSEAEVYVREVNQSHRVRIALIH